MDSLSRPEFHGIFDRVSMDIELKGAISSVGIENRLKIARHYSKTRAKVAKKEFMRKSYGLKAHALDNLIEHDFAGRAIYEANRDPKGEIAETLWFGREEAQKRAKVRAKARIRRRGAYIVQERKVAETVARGLASREKLRRRPWYAV